MSIKEYQVKGKKNYEVYVNIGFDGNKKRLQKRRKGFTSYAKAQRAETEFKRRLLNQKYSNHRDYTFAEFIDYCLANLMGELKTSTTKNYEGTLKKRVVPFIGKIRLEDVTPEHIRSLIHSDLLCELSPNSKKNILKMLRRIFVLAQEEKLVSQNPAKSVKIKVPETLKKALSASEAKELVILSREQKHPYAPVWCLALMTGMRSGELWALRWGDVDFERSLITVSRSWSSKNGFGSTKSQNYRSVPISNELESFLQEILMEGDCSPEDFVLPRLKEWKRGEAAKVLRAFCEAIGITSVKFHELRATFITLLLSSGVPHVKVMKIVGHSDLKITMGYVRLTGKDVVGATNVLDLMPRGKNDVECEATIQSPMLQVATA